MILYIYNVYLSRRKIMYYEINNSYYYNVSSEIITSTLIPYNIVFVWL